MGMRRQNILQISTLLLMVAFVTSLHYVTGTQHMAYHDIYRRLYYLPIILGGFWYCIYGGTSVALLVSVVYAPHVLFQWQNTPSVQLEQLLEILLYNLIGLVTGYLSSRAHAQRMRAEENIKGLSESYAKLKEQANLIVQIEDQLRQADRLTALGELSAGMAHEIRNPLGSIRGTAEILSDALPENSQYTEFSQILIKEVDRLNQVVENFLSFARPTSGEQKDFKPSEILLEVLQLSRQQSTRKKIQIHWQESPLPAALGDAAQFKQVFLNLILNAFQAMDPGGQLWINTEVSECGKIILQFRDSGPGIPSENLDRIFNPFFTTKVEGTGLGLAITYRIVQNHCGKISVENSPEGGAEFTITLRPADHPCRDGEQDASTDTAD